MGGAADRAADRAAERRAAANDAERPERDQRPQATATRTRRLPHENQQGGDRSWGSACEHSPLIRRAPVTLDAHRAKKPKEKKSARSSQWGGHSGAVTASIERLEQRATSRRTKHAQTTRWEQWSKQRPQAAPQSAVQLSPPQRGQTAAAGRTRRRRLSWRIVLRLEPTSCRAPMREGSHKHATAAVGAPRARSQLAALRDGARTDAADPATFCEQWSGRKAHARGALFSASDRGGSIRDEIEQRER